MLTQYTKWLSQIAIFLLALVGLLVSPNLGGAQSRTPAVNVDRFIGPDFIDFWWNPADVPGCFDVLIYRDGNELATVACGSGLYTDSAVSEGTAYQYALYFRNIGGSQLAMVNGLHTPGEIGGSLHRDLSLNGGTYTLAGSITLEENSAVLTLSSATLQASVPNAYSIKDNGLGQIVATGTTFNNIHLNLANSNSVIQNSAVTQANVGLSAAASVENTDFLSSTLSVALAAENPVQLVNNNVTNSQLIILEQSIVNINGGAFADTNGPLRHIWIRDESRVIINGVTMTGAPETFIDIDIDTTGEVLIEDSSIHFNAPVTNASFAYAVRQWPSSTTNTAGALSLTGNELLGHGADDAGAQVIGVMVNVPYCNGAAFPVSITGNTIAGFSDGVRLVEPAGCTETTLQVTITDNTISNQTNAGILLSTTSAVTNSVDTFTIQNNCLADNTYAVWCAQNRPVIDLNGNYWGHPTGPAHTLLNPGGLGDKLYCGSDKVTLTDWLSSGSCQVNGLGIEGLEVVQAVQTVSNTVPLVANKPTVVRVYPGVALGTTGKVGGTLSASRNGLALGSLNTSQKVTAGVINEWDTVRQDKNAGLNFVLPPDWVTGTVQLVAHLNAPDQPLNNIEPFTKTVNFEPRRPFKIVYIPVSLESGTHSYAVTPGDILRIHHQLQAIFPFDNLNGVIYPAHDSYFSSNPDIDNAIGFKKFSQLTRAFDQEYDPDNVADFYLSVTAYPNDIYGGYSNLHIGVPAIGGCSNINDGAICTSVVGTALQLRPLVTGIDVDSVNPPYNYTWPYAEHKTYEIGYNLVDNVISPADSFDVMSLEALLGGAAGVSKFHYERAFTFLAPAITRSPTSATASSLLVSGLAKPTAGYLDPIETFNTAALDGLTPIEASGPYCVQSIGSGNTALESVCFTLTLTNPLNGQAINTAPFAVSLSPNPDITAIRLRHGSTTLAEQVVAASAPELTLQAAGFDADTQSLYVKWQTPLNDAGRLRYNIFYSPDNGATWRAVGLNVVNPNYVDNAFQWGVLAREVRPGNNTRLRIVASDGYLTRTVTSAPFQTPDVGPWVGINTPANYAEIDSYPVKFSGFAYDTTAGDLGATLTWQSDLDGQLGIGSSLTITAGLSAGWHTISLSTADSQSNHQTATIRINVAPTYTNFIYLPLILK